MKSARWFTVAALVFVLVGAGLIAGGIVRNRQSHEAAAGSMQPGGRDVETVADGLQVPWGLAVLPDGDLLVTERPGTLTRIGKDRSHYRVDGVTPTAEGGLLGL